MNIVFTGGGSGGHFYPIIAVSQELRALLKTENMEDVEFFFMSDDPYNQAILDANGIVFEKNSTGKMRLYFSVENIFDFFRTGIAIVRAFFKLFRIYPDVVFSKGAYASFPVVCAARLLRIPVIIHESDSVPGRANAFAASFAHRIAISYPEASEFFPPDKVARTGCPIRKELLEPIREGSFEMFGFRQDVPVLFIIGGSQGAKFINDVLLKVGHELVQNLQIIHQIGPKNIDTFKATMDIILEKNPNKNRYVMLPYLDAEQMRRAAGIADLVVSRGGSTIFEIAAWGIPSIIIPITKSNGDHQRKNAFAYARFGACEVIEEENFTEQLFLAEVKRILGNSELSKTMRDAANQFATRDAAQKISREIVNVLKEHGRSYGKK